MGRRGRQCRNGPPGDAAHLRPPSSESAFAESPPLTRDTRSQSNGCRRDTRIPSRQCGARFARQRTEGREAVICMCGMVPTAPPESRHSTETPRQTSTISKRIAEAEELNRCVEEVSGLLLISDAEHDMCEGLVFRYGSIEKSSQHGERALLLRAKAPPCGGELRSVRRADK